MLLLLRILALLVGSFALALTLIVLVLYVKVGHRFQGNVTVYHVPLVAASHALLILSSLYAILFRVHHGSAFDWTVTPIAGSAFLLTSAILIEMLRSARLRGLQKSVMKGGE